MEHREVEVGTVLVRQIDNTPHRINDGLCLHFRHRAKWAIIRTKEGLHREQPFICRKHNVVPELHLERRRNFIARTSTIRHNPKCYCLSLNSEGVILMLTDKSHVIPGFNSHTPESSCLEWLALRGVTYGGQLARDTLHHGMATRKVHFQRILGQVLLDIRIAIVRLPVGLKDRRAKRAKLDIIHVHQETPAAVLVSSGAEIVPVTLHGDSNHIALRGLITLEADTPLIYVRRVNGQAAGRMLRQRRCDNRRAEKHLLAATVSEALNEESLHKSLGQNATDVRDVRGGEVDKATARTGHRVSDRSGIEVPPSEEDGLLDIALVLDQLLLRFLLRLTTAVQSRGRQSLRNAERVTLNLADVILRDLLGHADIAEGIALQRHITQAHHIVADGTGSPDHRAISANDGQRISRSEGGDKHVLAGASVLDDIALPEILTSTSRNGDGRITSQISCRGQCKARQQLVFDPLYLLRLRLLRGQFKQHRGQWSYVILQLLNDGVHIHDALVLEDQVIIQNIANNGRHRLSLSV